MEKLCKVVDFKVESLECDLGALPQNVKVPINAQDTVSLQEPKDIDENNALLEVETVVKVVDSDVVFLRMRTKSKMEFDIKFCDIDMAKDDLIKQCHSNVNEHILDFIKELLELMKWAKRTQIEKAD